MKLYTEEQVKDILKEKTFLSEDIIDSAINELSPIILNVENLAMSINKTVDHEGMLCGQTIAKGIVVDLIDGYIDKPYGADTNEVELYKNEYKELNLNR